MSVLKKQWWERIRMIHDVCTPLGEWADPGGTAIPGQPVEGSEQAPETPPMCKNQFNIVETR